MAGNNSEKELDREILMTVITNNSGIRMLIFLLFMILNSSKANLLILSLRNQEYELCYFNTILFQ